MNVILSVVEGCVLAKRGEGEYQILVLIRYS